MNNTFLNGISLSQLSYAELKELKKKVDSEIDSRAHEEKIKAKKQIVELARMHGFTVEEVLAKGLRGSRKTVEAKYRDPRNPQNTWTGRGRKPRWVVDLLAMGKKIQDLEI